MLVTLIALNAFCIISEKSDAIISNSALLSVYIIWSTMNLAQGLDIYERGKMEQLRGLN